MKNTIIVCVCILFVYGLYSFINNEIEKTKKGYTRKIEDTLTAFELLEEIKKDTNYLKSFVDKPIRLKGLLCEFSSRTSRGSTSHLIELTAINQTDSSIQVARPLLFPKDTIQKNWNACELLTSYMQDLYNLQEMEYKLYIGAQINYKDSIPSYMINESCSEYDEDGRRIRYHLENLCNQNVTIDGHCAKYSIEGKKIYITFYESYFVKKDSIDKKLVSKYR